MRNALSPGDALGSADDPVCLLSPSETSLPTSHPASPDIECARSTPARSPRDSPSDSLSASDTWSVDPSARRQRHRAPPWTDAQRAALSEAHVTHSRSLTPWAAIKKDENYSELLGDRSNGDLSRQFGRMKLPSEELGPRRNFWTKQEEDALRAGVRRHGVGAWKTILLDSDWSSVLSGRTNVQLKDKYRSLLADSALPKRAPELENSPIALSSSPPCGAAWTPTSALALLPRNRQPGFEPAPPGASERSDADLGMDLTRLPMEKRYLGYIDQLVHESRGKISTGEARVWLQRHPLMCPVPVHELAKYDIDHIIAKEIGGHDSPFNYVLMEKAANVRFKHYYTAEKERVLGGLSKEVSKIAQDFAKWCRAEATHKINYSAFRVRQTRGATQSSQA